MVKKLTEIKKTWGGRRAGAGRKKDPNSQRVLCEHLHLTPYNLRQAAKVRQFDAAFGTNLQDRIVTGELATRHAIRIAKYIATVWTLEGKPEIDDFDLSRFSKITWREAAAKLK